MGCENAINKGAVEVITERKMVDLRSKIWSWRVDGTHSQYLAALIYCINVKHPGLHNSVIV